MLNEKRAIAAVLIALHLAPAVAFAQGAAPASDAAKIDEARKRYQAGVKLYEDGDYEAARIEFERAYALAPSYRILYNAGLAYKQLNNYVGALNAFERYLAEGKSEVPPERRAEVEKEISELKLRVAQITVKTNVPGADVSIDDVPIGKTPLDKPVLVNPGVRKISATLKGRFPVARSITVGAGEKPEVQLDLAELPSGTSEKRNPWTVPTTLGWTVTALTAIGTGVTGYLAIKAKHDQDAALTTFGTTDSDRADLRTKQRTFATAADILGVTTIVFAGVSTYFTLRMVGQGNTTEKAPAPQAAKRPTFDVSVSPFGISAFGTF